MNCHRADIRFFHVEQYVTIDLEAVAPKLGADDRLTEYQYRWLEEAVAPKLGADDRVVIQRRVRGQEAVAPKLGADDRAME